MALITTSSARLALCLSAIFFGYALAKCECGYSITAGGQEGGETMVFTDLLESDFVHLDVTDADVYGEFAWAAQVFNKTKQAARGEYGVMYASENVVANTIEDHTEFSAPGSEGPDAGLHLRVDSEIRDGHVVNGEIATVDLDYFYGTYRAGIKVTDVPGTCSAFFWYFNDTQEIDIEFLSSQFQAENSSYPINLVLQSQESSEHGNDAAETGTFEKLYLPFDPTADFHEYRFDFLNDKVLFFVDGEMQMEMNGAAVPTSPGHLLLSHWSNGNPGWSKGPPESDATTTVSYVKAYYNSSSEARQDDFANRCLDSSAEDAVCAVPDKEPTHFFTYEDNMTPNQTTYGHQDDDENAATQARSAYTPLVVAGLASAAWAVGF